MSSRREMLPEHLSGPAAYRQHRVFEVLPACGMTLARLCRRAGIDTSYLYHVRDRRRVVTRRVVDRIVDTLGVPEYQLFSEPIEPSPQPTAPSQRMPMPERFWAKVQRVGLDECWPWQASKTGNYGHFQYAGQQYAHRVAYLLAYGLIPAGACVLHTCGNAACCNPQHLYVGTAQDNARDRAEHGRQQIPPPLRGAASPRAKLTEAEALQIIALRTAGTPYRAVLAQFPHRGRGAVEGVFYGHSWKHLHIPLADATHAAAPLSIPENADD